MFRKINKFVLLYNFVMGIALLLSVVAIILLAVSEGYALFFIGYPFNFLAHIILIVVLSPLMLLLTYRKSFSYLINFMDNNGKNKGALLRFPIAFVISIVSILFLFVLMKIIF